MKNLIAYCGLDCGSCNEVESCQTVGMIISGNAEAANNLKSK